MIVILTATCNQVVSGQSHFATLQPFLQPGLGIAQLLDIRQALQSIRKQVFDNGPTGANASVEKHGAEHRLDSIGEDRFTTMATGFHFTAAQDQMITQFDFKRQCRQRFVPDQQRAQFAEIALRCIRSQSVQILRNHEAENGIAEKFEPFIVPGCCAAVTQSLSEQLKVLKTIMQRLLEPALGFFQWIRSLFAWATQGNLSAHYNPLVKIDDERNIGDKRCLVRIRRGNLKATVDFLHFNVPGINLANTFYIETSCDRFPYLDAGRIGAVKFFKDARHHTGHFHVIQVDRRKPDASKGKEPDKRNQDNHAERRHACLASSKCPWFQGVGGHTDLRDTFVFD